MHPIFQIICKTDEFRMPLLMKFSLTKGLKQLIQQILTENLLYARYLSMCLGHDEKYDMVPAFKTLRRVCMVQCYKFLLYLDLINAGTVPKTA